MLFGYPVDPNFDPAKEERRTRVKWALGVGCALSLLWLFFKVPFATEVAQGSFATILCYGVNFYVDRRESLGERWLWYTILATTPMHIAYLVILFWSDRAFPSVMTKGVIFFPVVAIACGLESVLIDRIVHYFNPSSALPNLNS